MMIEVLPVEATTLPAPAPTMTIREGSPGLDAEERRGVISLIRLKILRTLRSRTFCTKESGVDSKGPP